MQTIEIGDIRVTVLTDGRFRVDGGAIFGAVPRKIWARLVEPDADNRIPLALHLYLVESAGRLVLVDAGMGKNLDEKTRRIYDVEDVRGVAARLAEAGVDPADIDAVVFTHLHFDHCGGAVEIVGGEPRAVLPNARHYVQRAEYEDALSPDEFTDDGYIDRSFEWLADTGALVLLDGKAEIVPGVRVFPAPGHTRAHQAVTIESRGRGAIHFGDLIPTCENLRPGFISALDCLPQQTLAAKKNLLARMRPRGWTGLFNHDPRRPFAAL